MSPSVVMKLSQVADFLLLLLSGMLAKSIRLGWSFDGQLFLATFAGSLITTHLLGRSKGYSLHSLRSLGDQLKLVAKSLLLAMGGVIVCIFLMEQHEHSSGRWPFAWFGIGFVLLTGFRIFLSRILGKWMAAGRLARRVAVVGVGDVSREFIHRLRAEPDSYMIVGLYDDRLSRVPPVQDGVAVRGTVQDLLERSQQEQIDVIAIALPLSAVERIASVLEELRSTVADVCLATDFAGPQYNAHQMSTVGANPVVLIEERPLKDWHGARKFAFDMIVGGSLTLIMLPFLAIIALLIRLDSPGPVIFRQPRLGFNNRLFTCYKFRTMRTDMTDLLADRQTTRDDPRVTRLGKWLRKLSLDELPQLFNVIKGDMSLVGPRPHAPNTKAADRLYADVVAQYALRHRVKPGITGWAQVNGWRGQTERVEQIENRVACDLDYIQRWSVWFDLQILMLTVTREILRPSAF